MPTGLGPGERPRASVHTTLAEHSYAVNKWTIVLQSNGSTMGVTTNTPQREAVAPAEHTHFA